MNNTQGNSSIKLGKGIAAPTFPTFPDILSMINNNHEHEKTN